MKKLITRASLWLSLIFCSVNVWASVNTEYDASIDFSVHKTYAWKAGLFALNAEVLTQIQDAVADRLQMKGLTRTDTMPDVYVVIDTWVRTTRITNINELGYSESWWRHRHDWGPMPRRVGYMPTRIITIDILESGSDKRVWQGYSIAFVSRDEQRNTRRMNAAARKLFRSFPPRKTKKPMLEGEQVSI